MCRIGLLTRFKSLRRVAEMSDGDSNGQPDVTMQGGESSGSAELVDWGTSKSVLGSAQPGDRDYFRQE